MTAAPTPNAKLPRVFDQERTREGTRKRPRNAPQEEAGETAMPDQTAEAGPLPLDQSSESDAAQKNLRGAGHQGGIEH